MSEIERAIEHIKTQDAFYLGDGNMDLESIEKMRECILKSLRAELEREKNPLTCDGCNRLVDRDSSIICVGCTRNPFKPDRYEQKGEKA